MSRIYNFSAGPATLPLEILQQAQAEFLDYQGLGYSILEMSHRSAPFLEVIRQTESDLRELLQVPDNYKVLFLHGGGQGQFATIPMNLLRGRQTADYCITGIWSKLAFIEAQNYCQPKAIINAEHTGFTSLVPTDQWPVNEDAAYCYYTENETVNGVEFKGIPKMPAAVPLVCDMSSSLLSRPFDIKQFGLVFACVQKNLGPAGVTLVIVREDLLGEPLAMTPNILNYTLQAEKKSLLNTPATFSWYMVGLMLQWLKKQGGLIKINKINQHKAQKLYTFIDEAAFYSNNVEPNDRSTMNVVFSLADESLNDTFLQQATDAGLANLKGHRTVGGMRASIYNAMPEAGVDKLLEFMASFAQQHSK